MSLSGIPLVVAHQKNYCPYCHSPGLTHYSHCPISQVPNQQNAMPNSTAANSGNKLLLLLED